MDYALSELDRRLALLLQPGVIEQVDHGAARCRVRVGPWVSAMLPWLSLGAGEVRHWRPPSVGEQALLLSPSGDPACGFVLPGFYTTQHGRAGDERPQAMAWRMPDGCVLEYDWESGALRAAGMQTAHIEAAGAVTLKCASLKVEADDVAFTGNVAIGGKLAVSGNVNVQGNIDAAGSVMDAGGNSNHHKH